MSISVSAYRKKAEDFDSNIKSIVRNVDNFIAPRVASQYVFSKLYGEDEKTIADLKLLPERADILKTNVSEINSKCNNLGFKDTADKLDVLKKALDEFIVDYTDIYKQVTNCSLEAYNELREEYDNLFRDYDSNRNKFNQYLSSFNSQINDYDDIRNELNNLDFEESNIRKTGLVNRLDNLEISIKWYDGELESLISNLTDNTSKMEELRDKGLRKESGRIPEFWVGAEIK